jgi:methylenetetrahydrofolate reductase (NADPH)
MAGSLEGGAVGRAAEVDAVVRALRRPRYEVLPLDGVPELVAEHVPTDVTVTVTASPAKGLDPTLDVAERLALGGHRVVPHLSARLIADQAQLKEILERLRGCGIGDALVIAGDAKEPAGPFGGALDLLAAMVELDHGLDEVGIAGYPERHPFIEDDVTIQAMWDKRHFATYIVSQVCFHPRVVAAWVRRVRRRGVELPIHVGVPGPIDAARLLRISTRIGIGESVRFVRRHTGWLPQLLRVGGYRPGRLVDGLAASLADSTSRVAGLHVYTFNEVARTERWRQQTLARLGAAADRQPRD